MNQKIDRRPFNTITMYFGHNGVDSKMEILMHPIPDKRGYVQQYTVHVTTEVNDYPAGWEYCDCAEDIAERIYRNHGYEYYMMFCRVVGLQITHGEDDYADGIPASQEDEQ